MNKFAAQYPGVVIAVVLQVLKARYGLPQRDAARALGIPPQMLSDLKNGRKVLSSNMRLRITKTFSFNWDQVVEAIPGIFTRPDEIVQKHLNDKDLYGVTDPSERYYKSMLNEVMELDVHDFPRFEPPDVPPPQEGSGLSIPILSAPVAGDPNKADEFTGQTTFLTGQAEAIAKRAPHAYVLRAKDDDAGKRFLRDDLLLVTQLEKYDHDAQDVNAYPVRVIRYQDELLLARLVKNAYKVIGPAPGEERVVPEKNNKIEIVGLVKAVLLSLLKR